MIFGLCRLYLRWNLIKKIENLEKLTTLLEIEFYDNQITEIENLETLVNLEWVDFVEINGNKFVIEIFLKDAGY